MWKRKSRVRCALRQRLAVDADLVVGADIERGRGQHLAIDGDAALRDPGFGVAARAKAGAGDDLGDAIAGLFGRGSRTRNGAPGALKLGFAGAAVFLTHGA